MSRARKTVAKCSWPRALQGIAGNSRDMSRARKTVTKCSWLRALQGTEGDFRSSLRRNRCKSPSIPLLQRGKCPAMSSSRSNIKNFNKFLN